jgi:N-methylhydantoinase A
LGGEFTLDLERTRRVVSEWLQNSGSRLELEQFAAGVIRVVNATMEKAIRVVSIERGYDTRDFTLVAFGGAGGLHACELAQALSIPRVLVSALPGALSAYGILVSDVVKDYSRTVLWQVKDELPFRRLEDKFASLRKSANNDFTSEDWSGAVEFRRSLDLRYRGQGHELNIDFSPHLLRDFHGQHERRYGYSHPGREVELVTLRLRASVRSRPAQPSQTRKKHAAVRATSARVNFAGKRVLTRIYERNELAAGKRFLGPAVITEYSATTVVPAGMGFCVDNALNLVITA